MKHETVSYRVVNLVRGKISTQYVTASDTDVARALEISRAMISAYKYGRDFMSFRILMRARKIAAISELEFMELLLDLIIEEDSNHEDLVFLASAKKALQKASSKVACILLGAFAIAGLSSPTPSEAYTRSDAVEAASTTYSVKRRRLLAWFRGLFRHFRPVELCCGA